VKEEIAGKFEVTDKGQLRHFIGMEIERDGKTGEIMLGQKQYILNMLKTYGMEDCKPTNVPLDAGHQVACLSNCKRADCKAYQSIIGALMYLSLVARPDITHSVVKLAQMNKDPHVEHMTAAKNILRYLKFSINLKLLFRASGTSLEAYADADWGGNKVDRKSFSGFVFYLGGCTIAWQSKKQTIVALSSTEAEYVSISNAAREAVYLNRILRELEFDRAVSVKLNVDNQGAMKLASNAVVNGRSKHIDIKYHHIRDLVQKGEVLLEYCPTNDMLADVLTKNLSRTKFENFVKRLNLM